MRVCEKEREIDRECVFVCVSLTLLTHKAIRKNIVSFNPPCRNMLERKSI